MWKYFKDLQRTLSTRELSDLAYGIATDYANPENGHLSKKTLAEDNEMTEKLLGEVLDYAVIESIVSEAVVDQMEKRAKFNQKRHSPDGKTATVEKHYAELRKKRVERQVFGFSDDKIRRLAERFANEPGKSKEEFAIMYGISKKTIDILLKKAITESICDDETFLKIEERSIKKNKSPEVLLFFEQLRQRREAKKENFFA